MRKIVLLLVISIIGCNSKSDQKNIPQPPKPKGEIAVYKEPKITGDKYFDYDEIIHYKNNFSEEKIGELYDNQKKSEKDAFRFGVILKDIPKEINSVDFLKNLESIDYKKSNVDSKKFKQIDKIFTEKKHDEVMEYACVYVYRDILIFKKKSKIIGIVKICFDCGDSIILGTKSNTSEFGQSGDYWKLEKLLSNK